MSQLAVVNIQSSVTIGMFLRAKAATVFSVS